MRLLFYMLGLVLATAACQKENIIKIPVHEASKSWFVDTHRLFLSNDNDTLNYVAADTTTQWVSQLADISDLNGFWDSEILTQTVYLDSNIAYQTVLRANLDSGYVRNDSFSSTFFYGDSQIVFRGFAHQQNIINLDSGVYYLPVWEFNGQRYEDVYYQEKIGSDHIVVFINDELNLVGFFINGIVYSSVQ